MINLFATNEELKRAHRHLDEARKEGNQTYEEQIMKAINEQCGTGTSVGAVSFSLPVSEVAGLRRLTT